MTILRFDSCFLVQSGADRTDLTPTAVEGSGSGFGPSANWTNWSAGKDVFDERTVSGHWNGTTPPQPPGHKEHVYGKMSNHRYSRLIPTSSQV